MTGVLVAAELSVVRRGSHVLVQNGEDQYFVESADHNLRQLQNKLVTLTGILELNADPYDLPVFVVKDIVDIEETVQTVRIPGLKMTLQIPVEWRKVPAGGETQFFHEDGEIIATIFKERETDLPEGGVPMVIGAERAVRLIDEFSGNQIVTVKRGEVLITLFYTPKKRADAERLRAQWLEVLNSVEFTEKSLGDDDVPTGTGSLGIPCGGIAGILCPDGQYCNIDNMEENIGHCRAIADPSTE